jgi:hypothetical protein
LGKFGKERLGRERLGRCGLGRSGLGRQWGWRVFPGAFIFMVATVREEAEAAATASFCVDARELEAEGEVDVGVDVDGRKAESESGEEEEEEEAGLGAGTLTGRLLPGKRRRAELLGVRFPAGSTSGTQSRTSAITAGDTRRGSWDAPRESADNGLGGAGVEYRLGRAGGREREGVRGGVKCSSESERVSANLRIGETERSGLGGGGGVGVGVGGALDALRERGRGMV